MNQYVAFPASKAQIAGVIVLAIVGVIAYKRIISPMAPSFLKI